MIEKEDMALRDFTKNELVFFDLRLDLEERLVE